jgi:hypothetical protein
MFNCHLNPPKIFVYILGETLADITASFAAASFEIRPDRSIHDPLSIAFLRDIVSGGDWVLNLLSHGLAFDWSTGPPAA